jgi:hypothetical protein
MTTEETSSGWTRRVFCSGLAGLMAAMMLVAVNATAASFQDERAAASVHRRQLPMRGQQQDTVVVTWNDACLEAIRTTRPGPPIVARALAMLHTAIYDAWAAYDRRALGTRFGGALRRPADEATGANRRKAISFAAYRALVDLFPSEQASFNALMTGLGVADGRGGFIVQKFIAPHWGNVTPFALTSASQFRPGPPKLLPEDEAGYRRQAQQLIRYSAELSDRTKAIAAYWSDGPSTELPPGHWTLFAEFVSHRDDHTLGQDVRMFFAMANALLDASISAWETKRFYDYVRPITAIHYLYAGRQIRAWAGPYQGTQLILGDDWQPYQVETLVTPAFAEYVSGHSTFSAAAAEVLKRFTGSDWFGYKVVIAAGSSRIEPGAVPAADVTLYWPTFSAAADQAGISRRYGGIHFAEGDVRGREVGRAVGLQAWTKARSYFNRREHCGRDCEDE